jgi:uncharacterized membrane protein YeaQ/YmgE (transglycosylase-associated protein family)
MAQLQPYMPLIILGIVGLIAGWLTGLLLGGGGLIRNLIVGVIGAFVGFAILKLSGLKLPYDFNAVIPTIGNDIVVATLGSIVIVILARIIAK